MVHAAICPNNPVQLLWAWQKSVDHLKPAIDRLKGRYLPEDIFNLLVAKDSLYHLWMVISGTEVVASCITQVVPYPQKKYLYIFLIGGKGLKQWESTLLGEIHNFALSVGCDGIETFGRKGWNRILSKYGFQDENVSAMEISWSNS